MRPGTTARMEAAMDTARSSTGSHPVGTESPPPDPGPGGDAPRPAAPAVRSGRPRPAGPDIDPRLAPALAGAFGVIVLPGWADALVRVPESVRAPSIVVSAAYALGCVVAVPIAQRTGRLGALLSCGVLLLLGATFVALTGTTNSWILLGALGLVAALLTTPLVIVVTVATVGAVLLAGVVDGTVRERIPDVVMLASTTLATALVVRLVRAHEELQRTRDELAAIAVLRERNRIAADLHDLLGHSLTTLTLKAGLARRLLAAGEGDRAQAEVADIERIGRSSLADVRAAVSGFRAASIAQELACARDALATAGMVAELPGNVPDVATSLSAAFGHVIREGVTNAVRHSGATRVAIDIEAGRLVVRDDGRGPQGPEGNGLRGLRERLERAGGTLSFGPDAGGGSRLVATGGPAEIDVMPGGRRR